MQSNIKALRKKRGLTQAALGDIVGVSQQVISRMEREREMISVDVLISLAEYFVVSTDCVLGRQEADVKMAGWVSEIPSTVGKEKIITLMEQCDNIRSREWLYLWFLIHAMNDK